MRGVNVSEQMDGQCEGKRPKGGDAGFDFREGNTLAY